jgi:undecaprenyl-diphosphatase
MNVKNKITLLILLIISFSFLTFLIITKNQTILNLDQYIFTLIHTFPFPQFLNTAALTITKLGNPYQSLTIFIVLGIFLIKQRNKISFYILTLAVGLGTLIPQAIKFLVERVRPVSTLLVEIDPSFPSGHATISCVFLLAIILLIAPLIKDYLLKYSLIVLSSVIFPLVALSRIYLSVHWASDVFAGILLGCISYLIADLSVSLLHKNN